jgi:hypothetical protein
MFENDNRLFREDEIEYIRTMIHSRMVEGNPASEEVNRLCTPFIAKGYNTIELLLREVL